MAGSTASSALLAALILVAGSAVPVVAQEEESVAAEGSASGEAPAPESEASTPSLPDDLPKRNTRDVPLFVGPATLEVSGKRGTYAWRDVLFGAEDVRTHVELIPKGESCAARVRLIEDGHDIVREWFSAEAVESGEQAQRDAVFAVDYLTGRLRVDTDCASWSLELTPLEDPDLEISIEELYYPVRGDSIAELIAGTEHVEGEWAALTEWYTKWVFWTEESDGAAAATGAACDVTDGQADLQVSITYPKWRQPEDADPALVREWERFMEALRVHEQGHVTIAVQGADAIDDRLDSGFTGLTCEESREMADDAADRIFTRYARASKRYDMDTDHGLTQGTGLGKG